MGEGFERQRAEAAALLQALDRKKAARTMAVPTDDKQVKARLREMGEPAILFGEGVSQVATAVGMILRPRFI
jgi:U4/U6 small nuclear ribonucleoprotein PRP4